MKHWTVEDGLPVNEIVHIAQTTDGYLWLATFDGLVRFDGDQFDLFNTSNTHAFPSNRFIEVQVDQYDNLWIVTEKVKNNEALIAYIDGQFVHFGQDHGVRGEVSLQLDARGNILIGSGNGAYYYDGSTLQSFGKVLTGKAVRKIEVDDVGVYWFATDQGVFRKQGADWTIFTERDGLDTRNTYGVHVDQLGKLWIGTETGIYVRENNVFISVEVDRPQDVQHYLNLHEHPDKPGQLFLIKDGQYMRKYEGGRFIYYPDVSDRYVFKSEVMFDQTGAIWAQEHNKIFREGEWVYTAQSAINQIFSDQSGNIWVAQQAGLSRLKSKLITIYSDNISSVYSLVQDDDGTVWATQQHQRIFQLQGHRFVDVTEHTGIPIRKSVYALYPSGDGWLWIGVQNGVYYWDKKTPAQLFAPSTNGHDTSTEMAVMTDIKGIQEDADGNMWFGGNNGLHRLDVDGNWHYTGKIGDDDILGVRIIYMTRDSTLWFGTNGNGLLYLKNGQLNQLDTRHGLSSQIIRSIYEDKKGILWIGTEGWGLNRIDRVDGIEIEADNITVYEKQNGLFDNVIHQILEDDQGRLWMSSNRGIFWVNRSELKALADGKISSIYSFFYSEQDGLPGREANGGVQTAGFKSPEGELWFPMLGGVVRIDPKQTEISRLRMMVEELNTADSTWHLEDVTEKVLPIGQREFQIRYSALDFSTSPANIHYRYKLEGYNDRWIEAGNRKEAVYNNLDPGTYTFKIMANNGEGWHLSKASLQITLPYYFYETLWFYTISGLLIVLLIYLGVNWRIRTLKQKGKILEDQVVMRTRDLIKEKEETERQKEIATEALLIVEKQAATLKELDQAKSRFFTNISHEFRTPLTLIIGPLEYQIEQLREGIIGDVKDMEVALRSSKRLLHLVNQILEVAKLESGHTQLQAQLIDIRTIVEPIVDGFRPMAERNGTHFSAEWPDQPTMVYIDIDMIEKAIMNLLSNAFKFTPKNGVITLRLGQEADHIFICIKDNGPGISKEDQKHIFKRFYQVDELGKGMQPGTGIGLSLVHELIALQGGTIELISEPGEGAEFLILLQSGKSHLKDDQLITIETSESREYAAGSADDHTEPRPDIDLVPIGSGIDQPILLIVEDNADIRTYVRKHLSTDYLVMEAENGLEGFNMTKEVLPDLVISDVMMPLSDGYDLCRKIKQHPNLDFIPVILLTARAEKSMKIEGLELGADDYIVKPFEIDELKARIRNLIQSRKKLKKRLANVGLPSKSIDLSIWVDTPFANRVRSVIEQHIGNENFSVVQLAEEVSIGRTTLYSRIVELTGKTPSEMIKLTRLYQASRLLKENTGNISEVAYAVGFKSISHFSKTFKVEFGVTPSQYARTHVENGNR